MCRQIPHTKRELLSIVCSCYRTFEDPPVSGSQKTSKVDAASNGMFMNRVNWFFFFVQGGIDDRISSTWSGGMSPIPNLSTEVRSWNEDWESSGVLSWGWTISTPWSNICHSTFCTPHTSLHNWWSACPSPKPGCLDCFGCGVPQTISWDIGFIAGDYGIAWFYGPNHITTTLISISQQIPSVIEHSLANHYLSSFFFPISCSFDSHVTVFLLECLHVFDWRIGIQFKWNSNWKKIIIPVGWVIHISLFGISTRWVWFHNWFWSQRIDKILTMCYISIKRKFTHWKILLRSGTENATSIPAVGRLASQDQTQKPCYIVGNVSARESYPSVSNVVCLPEGVRPNAIFWSSVEFEEKGETEETDHVDVLMFLLAPVISSHTRIKSRGNSLRTYFLDSLPLSSKAFSLKTNWKGHPDEMTLFSVFNKFSIWKGYWTSDVCTSTLTTTQRYLQRWASKTS